MRDSSTGVRLVQIRRIPGTVTQTDDVVRVYRHTPERIELQLRNPRWYASASLTANEARAIIGFLKAGLEDLGEG